MSTRTVQIVFKSQPEFDKGQSEYTLKAGIPFPALDRFANDVTNHIQRHMPNCEVGDVVVEAFRREIRVFYVPGNFNLENVNTVNSWINTWLQSTK